MHTKPSSVHDGQVLFKDTLHTTVTLYETGGKAGWEEKVCHSLAAGGGQNWRRVLTHQPRHRCTR